MSGDWDMMYNTSRMPENTNLANIYALMCPNWCFLFLRCMKYLFSAEVQSNLWIFWFLWLSKLLVLSRTPHRFQLTFSSDAISYNIFDGFFRQKCVEFHQLSQAIKCFVRVMEVECAVMIIRVFKNCECSEFLFWRGFARYTWGGQTAKHQQMIYGRYIGLAAAMHSPDELKLCSSEWVSYSFAFPSCLALAFCLGDQSLFSHYFFGIT